MEPFKNLLGLTAAQKIARALKSADPGFNSSLFLKNLGRELEPLELKARMHLIKDRLIQTLPPEPGRSFPLLIRAVESGLSGFVVWPLTEMVSQEGQGDFDLSMRALETMTQAFTAEFAIRRFLLEQETRTLKQLKLWTTHSNEHVRRLVSEGSRPLLPWGQKLHPFIKDPEKTWPLLEALKLDPAKYVQKSVANHLNDHSKNHPEWLIKKLSPWSKEPGLQWILRHGTRTLIKKGHPQALGFQGVTPAGIKLVKAELLTPKLDVGQTLRARVVLRNTSREKKLVLLDHEVYFLKSRSQHQGKIFKGHKLWLESQATWTVEVKLPLRAVTTRRYYSGPQFWQALVNGSKGPKRKFQLVKV